MTDIFSILGGVLGIIASAIIIGSAVAAVCFYFYRRSFAGGKWNIRSVSFYPPNLVNNIKLALTEWQEALPGETLPPETLRIADPEGKFVPIGGLKRVKLTRTGNPPAVVLHFDISNPSVVQATINEITFAVQRSDGKDRCEFFPVFFGKKDAPPNSRVPAGLPFDEHWSPIVLDPSSTSEHRLVLIPKTSNVFRGLTPGKYVFSVEPTFDRLFKRFRKKKQKTKHITYKFDAEEELVKDWSQNKPVVVPYSLLRHD
jgi:hypothetical protein